jgi:hypothetical protein
MLNLRLVNILAIAAFACLVTGFGFALWIASKHQESRSQNSQYYESKTGQRSSSGSAIQINCDPNCAAEQSNEAGNWSFSKYLVRFINDPLTVATLLLVGVVLWQVGDARHSSERQLRAYLGIKTVLFYRPDTGDGDRQEWPIHVVYNNAGQTPAYAAVVTAESYLGQRKPIDEIFVVARAAEVSPPSIVQPGARHTMRLGGLEPGHEKFLAAQRAEMYCYVWGRIDYTDTFGRQHFTKFQMWQNFTAVHQFGFCQVGNVSDDEFPEGWSRRLLLYWRRKRQNASEQK